MDDTGLNHRFGKHSGDRFGKALQAIDDSEQNVPGATVPERIHDPEPECDTLILLELKAQQPTWLRRTRHPTPPCSAEPIIGVRETSGRSTKPGGCCAKAINVAAVGAVNRAGTSDGGTEDASGTRDTHHLFEGLTSTIGTSRP